MIFVVPTLYTNQANQKPFHCKAFAVERVRRHQHLIQPIFTTTQNPQIQNKWSGSTVVFPALWQKSFWINQISSPTTTTTATLGLGLKMLDLKFVIFVWQGAMTDSICIEQENGQWCRLNGSAGKPGLGYKTLAKSTHFIITGANLAAPNGASDRN